MAIPDVVMREVARRYVYIVASTFLLGLGFTSFRKDDVSIDGRIIGLGGVIGASLGFSLARRLGVECPLVALHLGYGSLAGAAFTTLGSLATKTLQVAGPQLISGAS